MARSRFTTAIGVLSITALAAACSGQPAEDTLPEEGIVPEEPAPPAPEPAAPMDTAPTDTADTTGMQADTL